MLTMSDLSMVKVIDLVTFDTTKYVIIACFYHKNGIDLNIIAPFQSCLETMII